MLFTPTVRQVADLPHFSQEVIAQERSLCRVSIAEAYALAGPAHRAFLEALPRSWRADPHVEVFSRMLWMKRGWLPFVGGFHCDWGPTAQSPGPVQTLMANFGGCSYTELVTSALELEDPAPGVDPRRHHARQVTRLAQLGALEVCSMPSEVLFLFDNQTWHRATPATETGWRLLVRAIRGLDPARRHQGGDFSSYQNGYLPMTPEQEKNYAPYQTPPR
jgi:hypothetical protein